jgi:hypothetical protein
MDYVCIFFVCYAHSLTIFLSVKPNNYKTTIKTVVLYTPSAIAECSHLKKNII